MPFQKITLLLFGCASIISCGSVNENDNPLRGLIFRDIREIKQLDHLEPLGGSVIENLKNRKGDYGYGISHYRSGEANIVMFEEFVYNDGNPDPGYKILDTIAINNIDSSRYVTYCNCIHGSTADDQIIALVVDEDKEYLDSVIRAWRVDVNTGEIVPIENPKGIRCINEGFGLEGCGEEE